MPGLVTRSIGALRGAWDYASGPWRYGTRAPAGRVILPSKQLDCDAGAISDGLNFTQLKSLLRSADDGNLAQGLQLFQEMERKDPTLCSVANTRRTALTGLEYEIVSAAEVQETGDRAELADEAAGYVRERLCKVDTFEEFLEHLSTGIGTNLAVAELVWDRCELAAAVDVPSSRLIMDQQVPGQINVITEDDRMGVPAASPKFVIHSPHSACGHPLARSIFRAQAFVFLIKLLAIADWTRFCEVFGMPVRWGTYRSGATTEEKRELVAMMENLGSSAWGVFSEGVQLEMKESSQRGTAPYKDMIEFCERLQAKVWLGGHLTSDTTGGTGTFAAASVHNEVRENLRDDDIRREARTIRRQVLAPMCAFKFARDVPVPFFRRVRPEIVDRIKEATLFTQSQQAGVVIPRAYAYNRLGIPEPKRDERGNLAEPVITPSIEAESDMLMEGI